MPSFTTSPNVTVDPSARPCLEVRLLGALEIAYRSGETAVPRILSLPPTVKSQSLLAYLILHTSPPPTRERLAALFWPERPPHRARRSLSTALWHIRRCFPVECLQADTHTVRFAFPGDVTVDVHTFEHLVTAQASPEALAQAVSLYRGDLLEGFYDDWALNLRYRLQSYYLDALTRLMRVYEARHDDRAALQTSLRLLEADPLSEAACQTALRAYTRLGQREAALELYHRFTSTLRDELDAEPSPETVSLYRRLAERSNALERLLPVSSTVPASPRWRSLPAWLTASGEPPLVGREAALQHMRRAWAVAASGRFHSVWIYGEAGIGKSRLLEAFAREVQGRGAAVLWGRCARWESESYAPLSDLLRSALSEGEERVVHDISPWQAAALAQLAPELSDFLPPEHRSATSLSTGGHRPLLRALAYFMTAAARRAPLMIALEDLHWASTDILSWLPLLSQTAATVPLLLAATCRREEIPEDHPLPALIWRWQSEGLADVLDLSPLSLADLGEWFPQATPALLRALHQHTTGNPFFVMETLRALVDGGQLDVSAQPWAWQARGPLPIPDTVRQAVSLRWKQLPSHARQALEVAAVLGKDFDLETWREAWGREEDDVLAALDVLLRRGWITEGRGPFALDYTFSHHVTREVVYRNLTAARRRMLHLKVARALARVFGGGEGHHASIAFHYLQAEAWDEAWPYLLRAGDRAANLAATAEALTCYTQAQQARQRATHAHRQSLYDAALSRKIGDIHFRRGEYGQAEAHLRESLHLLGRPFPSGTWRARAALLLALTEQLVRRMLPFPVGRMRSPERDVIAEEVSAYTTLGWIYTLQGRHEAYLLVSLRALNAAEKASLSWGEAVAATALGLAADFLPGFRLAGYFHRRALRLLPQLHRPYEVGFVHFGVSYHALLTAQEELALQHAAWSAEAYRRAGTPQRWALAVLLQGYVYLYRGELSRVAGLTEMLTRAGEELDAPSALSSGLSLQGLAARWQGRAKQAMKCFQEAARLAAQVPDHMSQVENLGELACCLARLGRWEEAREMLRRSERIVAQQAVGGDSLVRLRLAAADVALVRLSHLLHAEERPLWRETRQAVQRAWKATRAFHPARPEACRLRGELSWLSGDRAAARRWWQRSRMFAQAYGHALDWAVVAFESGIALNDHALAQRGLDRLSACEASPNLVALPAIVSPENQ